MKTYNTYNRFVFFLCRFRVTRLKKDHHRIYCLDIQVWIYFRSFKMNLKKPTIESNCKIWLQKCKTIFKMGFFFLHRWVFLALNNKINLTKLHGCNIQYFRLEFGCVILMEMMNKSIFVEFFIKDLIALKYKK